MSAARQRWRVALSLVSLLAAACGGGPASSPVEPAISSPTSTRTAPPTDGVREDLERFHFQAETLDGTSVDTRAFVGREPVAFWAWAPWCSTCNREAPGVRDAVVRYGGSIRFVGLPGLDDAAPMRVFVQRHELTAMPHAVDRQGDLWRQLGVRGQPTWVLVDVEGNVERLFGLVDAADLDRRLARLAGEPGHGGS
ncbi:MAG: TlpA family protein disulfide reductase [Actinomycetota bacterium]|nr:TlpA family protein disulfide reductase [Actinomycetota bacterium]